MVVVEQHPLAATTTTTATTVAVAAATGRSRKGLVVRPLLGPYTREGDVVSLVRRCTNVDNDRKEAIKGIGSASLFGRIEQAQFFGKRDAVGKLDESLETFLVLEPFEMERQDLGQGTNAHPLLSLLQVVAHVTEEFVTRAENLVCAEGAQARGKRCILFDINGQVEEFLIPRGGLE